MQTPTYTNNPAVGIDDMAVYLPHLCLPIESLAEARQLEYAKLQKGLGLETMAVADAGEDAATMMANAVWRLLQKNDLKPQQVGRMYLGTESALDGAKPTATYALEMLSQQLAPEHGADCLLHCDVVDLTFACIGAVDAMQNTLDWVRNGPDRIGIIVAADLAKYELGSGGEYTQGAGAVAILIKQQPRLLAFAKNWGVATRPVHDFFKPRRRIERSTLVKEVLDLAQRNHVDISTLIHKLDQSLEVKGVIDANSQHLEVHRDTPIFDGHYSNDCYQERIREALDHFVQKNGISQDTAATDAWSRLIFHLPYAYQARRMFGEIFLRESQKRGDFSTWSAQIGIELPEPNDFTTEEEYKLAFAKFVRSITKTDRYRAFVKEKIEGGERASSQVGNLYTASLFLSLMSSLNTDWKAAHDMAGKEIGFFAYGSGSKSKVFSATIQEGWQEVVAGFDLENQLSQRKEIDYTTYESLHRQQVEEAITPQSNTFYLHNIHLERDEKEGARTYQCHP